MIHARQQTDLDILQRLLSLLVHVVLLSALGLCNQAPNETHQ